MEARFWGRLKEKTDRNCKIIVRNESFLNRKNVVECNCLELRLVRQATESKVQ